MNTNQSAVPKTTKNKEVKLTVFYCSGVWPKWLLFFWCVWKKDSVCIHFNTIATFFLLFDYEIRISRIEKCQNTKLQFSHSRFLKQSFQVVAFHFFLLFYIVSCCVVVCFIFSTLFSSFSLRAALFWFCIDIRCLCCHLTFSHSFDTCFTHICFGFSIRTSGHTILRICISNRWKRQIDLSFLYVEFIAVPVLTFRQNVCCLTKDTTQSIFPWNLIENHIQNEHSKQFINFL